MECGTQIVLQCQTHTISMGFIDQITTNNATQNASMTMKRLLKKESDGAILAKNVFPANAGFQRTSKRTAKARRKIKRGTGAR